MPRLRDRIAELELRAVPRSYAPPMDMTDEEATAAYREMMRGVEELPDESHPWWSLSEHEVTKRYLEFVRMSSEERQRLPDHEWRRYYGGKRRRSSE